MFSRSAVNCESVTFLTLIVMLKYLILRTQAIHRSTDCRQVYSNVYMTLSDFTSFVNSSVNTDSD